MINLLLGAPGGGKSYEAVVFHALPALMKGRKVVTNLPLDLAAFGAIDPALPGLIEIRTNSQGAPKKDGSPCRVFGCAADYSDPWRHADGFGPLFIIDECHMAMPKGTTDIAVEEWFSMHRHHNVDVLLITQSYAKISQSVRDLVQMVYRVRKNVALGSPTSYTRKVQDGLRGEVVNTTIRKYQKRYFSLYRSHTQGQAVSEFNASDVRPIWMHWSVIGAAILFTIVVVMVASGKVSMPWKSSPPDSKPNAVAKPAAVYQASLSPRPAASSPMSARAASAALAAAQAASEPPLDPEPFAGRGVHLSGYLEAGKRRMWTFTLSQNGQGLGSITDAELLQAGYTWRGDSQCSGLLTYGAVKRAIVCDAPSVSIGGTVKPST